MQVLHEFRDSTVVTSEQSVWNAVERQIENRQSRVLASLQPQRQFHGGIVALCACSLVLAFVTIVQQLPVNDAVAHGSQTPDYLMGVSTGNVSLPGETLSGQMVPVFDENFKVIGYRRVGRNGQTGPVQRTQILPAVNGVQNY